MLNQYEELAVLDQGDDGAIVSIRGQGGPCVLLGPNYLRHLDRVLAVVLASELKDRALSPQVHLLCAEVQTLLSTYEEIQNKFYGGGAPAAARSTSQALADLAEMRKQLEKFQQ